MFDPDPYETDVPLPEPDNEPADVVEPEPGAEENGVEQ